jgi:Raf kinase inhibitor-like YbhB/YbcL family protein
MIAALAAAFFVLTSPAFSNGAVIPKRFIDAPGGTFVHWTGWNLRPTVRRLTTGAHLPVEGTNSAGTRGYTGPCPPVGPAHHYVFRLYALKAKLNLRAGASPARFHAALRGRVVATARLVGRYRR